LDVSTFSLEISNFDTKTKTMRGFGEDHKDRFRLIGTFCPETKTMQITWSYRVSTRRLNHLIFSICMYNYIFI